MSKVLTHSTKSYIKIFFVGILVGCICRLLLPNKNIGNLVVQKESGDPIRRML